MERCRAVNGISRGIGDIDKYIKEQGSQSMKDHIARRQAYFVSLKKPFRVLEPVEAWKKEYSEALKERKKTLVLEGGTCLGKTQYIRNLFGADCCFEVHASSPTSWSLRDFVPLQHKCILWDEATPQVMIQNKVLFQCPSVLLTLGNSPTANFTYDVWVNDCVMVINSNCWTEQLKEMPPGDRNWIVGNTVHVVVDSPLWVEEEVVAAAAGA